MVWKPAPSGSAHGSRNARIAVHLVAAGRPTTSTAAMPTGSRHGELPEAGAGHEEHHEGRQRDDARRAQVGLEEDQEDDRQRDEQERQRAAGSCSIRLPAVRQPVGQVDDQGQLGQLGRMDRGQRADLQPAREPPTTIGRAAGHEHQHQERERERRRRAARRGAGSGSRCASSGSSPTMPRRAHMICGPTIAKVSSWLDVGPHRRSSSRPSGCPSAASATTATSSDVVRLVALTAQDAPRAATGPRRGRRARVGPAGRASVLRRAHDGSALAGARPPAGRGTRPAEQPISVAPSEPRTSVRRRRLLSGAPIRPSVPTAALNARPRAA